MVKHIVYCDTCEKVVELRRKCFEQMYQELLCFMFLSVVLIPVYFILKYRKKKNTCPHCESVFDLKNLPKLPENLTMPVKKD